MRVTSMDWAGLLSENYEASQNFLSKKIGLSLQFEAKKSVVSHFRLPSGQLLELYGPSKQYRGHEKFRWFDGHALGFEVDNLDAAYREMIDRGVHFIHEIETWKEESWCMFLGPENKLLQIQQSGPRSPEPQAENPELLGFSWAGVILHDFDAAVRFFSRVMEMPLARRDDSGTSAQFWLPDGHLFEVLGPTHTWSNIMEQLTIGFQVEDVKQVKVAMEERGVEFVSGIEVTSLGHEFAFFHDLDNYLYALWKPGEVG
jgi:catechol 2,3-dioxygenase-like lactoylglutathione lyase family enzyme